MGRRRLKKRKADLHKFYRSFWTPEFWGGYVKADIPCRRYRMLRQETVMLTILRSLQGKLILDAGCGYGRMSELILQHRPEVKVVGVDISESMICESSNWLGHRFAGYVGDLTSLPFPDATFDSVICIGVIMHVADEGKVMRELARVLRPGGHLVLTFNNLLSPFAPFNILQRKLLALARKVLKRSTENVVKQSFGAPLFYIKELRRHGVEVLELVPDTVICRDLAPLFPFLSRYGIHFVPRQALSLLKPLDGLMCVSPFKFLSWEPFLIGIKK